MLNGMPNISSTYKTKRFKYNKHNKLPTMKYESNEIEAFF